MIIEYLYKLQKTLEVSDFYYCLLDDFFYGNFEKFKCWVLIGALRADLYVNNILEVKS